MVVCPRCGSERLWKDGFYKIRQRWLCQECGHRFSEPKNSNVSFFHNSSRRVCVSLAEGTKNLVKVETVKDGLGTAATEKPGDAEIKGKIVEFLWYLKKENYAESTIQRYVKEIKLLDKRGANLLDPESVKEVIARQKWVDNRRAQTYHVYNAFAKMLGKT